MTAKRTTRKAKGKAQSSKPARPSPYVVFISYTTADSYIAHAIKKDIEELDRRIEAHVYEQDLRTGGFVADNIRKEIKACHEAVALITSNTLKNRDWLIFSEGLT